MRFHRFSKHIVTCSLACAGVLGCDDLPAVTGSGGSASSDGAGGGTSSGGSGGGDPYAGGTAIEVEVPASGRAYLDLDTPAIGDGASGWELAFEGQDVFTNGGASGSGKGSAFGPSAAAAFLADTIPEHPFMIEDESGGAFLDWYAYDGSIHALYSRYHVYGVRRGEAVYKVQVLGYYGDIQGAPTSAIYSLRVAAVKAGEVAAATTIEGIDATAGGPSGGDDAKSACVVLASGATLALTVAEAAASTEWDLCFRRASIAVNGDLGGPGDVTAVDLDREATAGESLEEVMARTAMSELGRFDEVTAATLADPKLPWRGDHIVSAFSDHWIEPGSQPIAPAAATWLVAGSDGTSPFLVAFDHFSGATAVHPGTVRVVVKTLGGSL